MRVSLCSLQYKKPVSVYLGMEARSSVSNFSSFQCARGN